MSRRLSLTEDQFEVLYDSIEEEIFQIRDNIEDTDLTLNDYEIYKVFQKLKKMKEAIWWPNLQLTVKNTLTKS